MEANVYTQAGKASGKVSLPTEVFGVKWNPDLVHEVVVSMQSNARSSTANAKDRSEVSGGGRKPWKQKGTGRARHGSRRSPIWKGGGVTHGPTSEKDYSKKINKKVRAKALASTLSQKLVDEELVFINELTFSRPKASEAKTVIEAIAKATTHEDLAGKKKNATLIVLNERNEGAEKSFRNFGNVIVAQVKDINPVDLLTFKYVVIANPEESIKILETRVGKKS